MPVPVDDSVCRFIRQKDWSTELNKPKARLFKQQDLSVWHTGRLAEQGATLDDLRIEDLAGSGQLNLTVGEYLDIASEVSSRIGQTLQVRVEWRPDDQFVKEPWRRWQNAHAQVEMTGASWEHFPPAFRDLAIITAQRKEVIIPPDLDANEP
jgi:hypothetical protein